MRLVIDTNVLVSGLINPYGAPGRILDAVLANRVIPLFDDRILGEYREVLRRSKFGFRPTDIRVLLEFIERAGEPVIALPLNARPLSVVLPDPTDLPFLEVAVAAHADLLVTGNPKHFRQRLARVAVPAEAFARLES